MRELATAGPDQVRLVLVAADDDGSARPAADGELRVALDAGDPEFAIRREWETKQSVLGAVVPTGSRIIRLRSLDDLEPLTLRRLGS